MKRIVLLAMLASLLMNGAFAYAKGDAGDAGAFLKMGIGARPLALGKAFVGVADDANAPYWNPAGMTEIDPPELTTMFSQPFSEVGGINYHMMSFVNPTEFGAWGLSLIYLNVGGIKEAKESDPTGVFLTGVEFEDTEMALLLSGAKRMNPRLSYGGSLKIVTQEMKGERDSGVGLDLSLLWKPNQKFRLGIMTQDILGANIRGDQMPIKLRLGGAYTAFDRVMITVGGDIIENRSIKGHLGLELALVSFIDLRGGYSTDNEEFSYGAGLKWDRWKLDYTHSTHPDLGDTQRVSFGVRF